MDQLFTALEAQDFNKAYGIWMNDPEWQKQVVYYRTTEAPGTIIISSAERHLYLIQPGGRAIRYGIGVGRDGFQWQGLLNIARKAEWPDWTPPPEHARDWLGETLCLAETLELV